MEGAVWALQEARWAWPEYLQNAGNRQREHATNWKWKAGNSRGRGRASNSSLPSWYPRTPLRDITAIVRAIERRERLGADRAQEIESPVPHAYGVLDLSEPSSVAHLEHSNLSCLQFQVFK
ncbi:hypothetical protein GH714_039532 [Hevea brasiliensis]|uniref:Uncharacterized protein n=1 Tax=Hevea brasiliensis TaxID=3981 RepID=A0A6A6KEI5_HEVBR|nr:hypothetical protein GH714_039532 [Hevea brasiliensis]